MENEDLKRLDKLATQMAQAALMVAGLAPPSQGAALGIAGARIEYRQTTISGKAGRQTVFTDCRETQVGDALLGYNEGPENMPERDYKNMVEELDALHAAKCRNALALARAQGFTSVQVERLLGDEGGES